VSETRFRIESSEPLGKGRFGSVWNAYDCQLKRAVALKFLETPATVDREEALEHVRALIGCQHPNVLVIHDIVQQEHPDSGNPSSAIVMELCDGGSLKSLIEGPRVPPAQVRSVLRGLLAGLQAIHESGTYHGDIHPGNVMFHGTIPKLGDPAPIQATTVPRDDLRQNQLLDLGAAHRLCSRLVSHMFGNTSAVGNIGVITNDFASADELWNQIDACFGKDGAMLEQASNTVFRNSRDLPQAVSLDRLRLYVASSFESKVGGDRLKRSLQESEEERSEALRACAHRFRPLFTELGRASRGEFEDDYAKRVIREAIRMCFRQQTPSSEYLIGSTVSKIAVDLLGASLCGNANISLLSDLLDFRARSRSSGKQETIFDDPALLGDLDLFHRNSIDAYLGTFETLLEELDAFGVSPTRLESAALVHSWKMLYSFAGFLHRVPKAAIVSDDRIGDYPMVPVPMILGPEREFLEPGASRDDLSFRLLETIDDLDGIAGVLKKRSGVSLERAWKKYVVWVEMYFRRSRVRELSYDHELAACPFV